MQIQVFRIAVAVLTIAFLGVLNRPAGAQTPLNAQLIKSGLTRPVFVTSPPGDYRRLFIVEQRGSSGTSNRADIRIMDISTHVIYANPFLSVSPVNTGNEEGLLGLAFHPNYASNRKFYTYHTNSSGNNVVTQWLTSTADSNRADPFSDSIILTLNHPFESNHNGGWIAFGPDGYLYIATGDGGGQGNEHENSQNLETLLGKILRIDVNSGSPYSIPPDNPFFGTSLQKEIFYWGLRNPWRNSFDRLNDQFYIADVGGGLWEEIDWRPADDSGNINFGWQLLEGTHCYNPSTNCDPSGITTLPIHEYSHDFGCSVNGGYVYRGCAIPDLQGTYFFGDYCSGKIWSFRYNGTNKTELQERQVELGVQALDQLVSFGEDNFGELYLLYLTGQIYKIVADQAVVDCNENGLSDSCEIAVGLIPDANSNWVIDSCESVDWICGDGNGDNTLNIADCCFLIAHLYAGGPAPDPMESGDVNCDAGITSADAVSIMDYIFKGGAAPCDACK